MKFQEGKDEEEEAESEEAAEEVEKEEAEENEVVFFLFQCKLVVLTKIIF